MRTGLGLLIAVAFMATSAGAAAAAGVPRSWPPATGPGTLYAHFGEDHIDDDDGMRIFPAVVRDVARYRPRVALSSADKSSDGTEENLTAWKELIKPLQKAGVPVFASPGNHDRKAPPGVPGGLSPIADPTNYLNVFADLPYPFGDATPPAQAGFAPGERPVDDPAGASTHYAFDAGPVRWIVLDNSCYGLTNCDSSQNPPFPDGGASSQLDFLARRAAEADAAGRQVFVVMHMPTQDPRPGHTQPTPSAHTMGEGASPDNAAFESAAAVAGVDGVFAGHIKGQWIYAAQGDVPYFTDGGAGGEVYVGDGEEVGVDYGYWHGYRLVRVQRDGTTTTDAVPVFVPGGVTIVAPDRLSVGAEVEFSATGAQPTQDGPKVDALQLRDPDPSRPNAANLPSPARIWTTGDPQILAPIPASADDPRRDRETQTRDGRFKAVCPGRTRVSITSGWETARRAVRVASTEGRIVRSIARGPTVVRRGHSARAVRIRLAQPGRVAVRLDRRELLDDCLTRGARTVRLPTGLPLGTHHVSVVVRSDRRPVERRFSVRVLRQL